MAERETDEQRAERYAQKVISTYAQSVSMELKHILWEAQRLAREDEREQFWALSKRWRDSAAKSRDSLSQTSEEDVAWSTELETNMNDLEMCAENLETLIRSRQPRGESSK